MSPSRVPEGESRGHIVPIGGAENKENDPKILARFVQVSGGGDADIVVIPTASRAHETGERYEKIFRELGAQRVDVMDFDTRRDCQEQGRLDAHQRRHRHLLHRRQPAAAHDAARRHAGREADPRAERERRDGRRHQRGRLDPLGAHDRLRRRRRDRDRRAASASRPGLGLTNRFIIDQHFRERDRLGRLITALAYNPFAVGLGLDEDTAAFIGPDETLEVEGTGGVTVVDASKVSFSSVDSATEGQPICILGLVVHVLTAGASFNLHTRQASATALIQSRE